MAQPTQLDETEVLLSCLNDQRAHVLDILDELDDETLRRPVLPSGWTCLGLVQHLALDVERFWFRAVAAGERAAIDSLPHGAEGRQVAPDVSPSAVLALYRDEIARADAIIAAMPPGAAPAWWPGDLFGDWRLDQLRQITLHVITETAVHAGHLDIVRELIDGRQWRVLTDWPVPSTSAGTLAAHDRYRMTGAAGIVRKGWQHDGPGQRPHPDLRPQDRSRDRPDQPARPDLPRLRRHDLRPDGRG